MSLSSTGSTHRLLHIVHVTVLHKYHTLLACSMVCNRRWHLPWNPWVVWHPAWLITEGGCLNLSMDTMHLWMWRLCAYSPSFTKWPLSADVPLNHIIACDCLLQVVNIIVFHRLHMLLSSIESTCHCLNTCTTYYCLIQVVHGIIVYTGRTCYCLIQVVHVIVLSDASLSRLKLVRFMFVQVPVCKNTDCAIGSTLSWSLSSQHFSIKQLIYQILEKQGMKLFIYFTSDFSSCLWYYKVTSFQYDEFVFEQ